MGDETLRTNASFVQLLKRDEFDSQMQQSCKAAKLWCTNPEPWTVQMLSLSHMLSGLNGFLKLLSAKDITFSLANISFFIRQSIHPFIHYAFMEVGTCALVTTEVRGQLMEFTKLVLSFTLWVPEMELELSGLETIHAEPSHWPTKLIFNWLLFVF